jgi:hypothetical protein
MACTGLAPRSVSRPTHVEHARYVYPMAVEINSSGGFGESISLHGEDAERFLEEVVNPSTDERRLAFLKRSDETFERLFSPEPIRELPTT